MKFLVSPMVSRLPNLFMSKENEKSYSGCGRFCTKCGKDCPEQCGSKCSLKV